MAGRPKLGGNGRVSHEKLNPGGHAAFFILPPPQIGGRAKTEIATARSSGAHGRTRGMPHHLQQDIAAAAIEACARELEAWAEITQRADLVHAAAQTLRRNSAMIIARALTPAS
jgi:hypothetical protein